MFRLNGINQHTIPQLLLLCVPVLCLILLIAGLTFHQSRQQAELLADYTANRLLAETRTHLTDALSIPYRDLTGIARAPLIQEAIREPDLDQKKELFSEALSLLIYQNPEYFQVRWIQGNGFEGVRLDAARESEEIRAVPGKELQDKSRRNYHRKAMALAAYELYVSQPDLNREHGELEQPIRPTMRVALRLPATAGEDNGYLIINVDIGPILEELASFTEGYDLQMMVGSSSGDWLLHPDPALTWASDRNHPNTMEQSQSALWPLLQGSGRHEARLDSGRWFWTSIKPAARNQPTDSTQLPTIYLLLNESPTVIAARESKAMRLAATAFILLLMVFSIPATLFYRRLVQSHHLRQDLEQQTRELSDYNQFINTLTNALPGLVSLWDNDELCQYANSPHQDWLGLEPEQLRGMPLHDVLGDQAYRNYLPYLERVRHGRRQTFEQTLSRPEYDDLAIQVTLIPFSDSDNQRQGFISLTTDISDSAKVRKTLQSLNVTLQERSQAAEHAAQVKSAFLANMSHEIRTPMNAILGLLSILADTGLTRLQRDYVEKITGAGNALLQVLNDILDLSKLEAGKLSVVEQPFSIEEVIQKSMQLFELGFASKQLEQLLWIDPALPKSVLGDDHRLGQVLNNLLGNALKFTETGSVLLSAALEPCDEDDVVKVRFAVKDTGIGISKEKQSFLFNAFDQADNSTTRKYGGSGLGLAICRNLVQLMGGDIQLDSAPNLGSEFSFTLGFKVVDPNPDWNRALMPIRRALLVEDNPASAALMLSYLISWNVVCEHVASAEEGLDRYLDSIEAGHPFDTLLIDWILPGKDGVWLVNSLQNHLSESNPLPVIVMVTAQEQEQLQQALNRVLVSPSTTLPSILTKPVTPSALFNTLSNLGHEPIPLMDPSSHEAMTTDLDSVKSLLAGSRLLLVEDNELNQEVALSLLAKLGLSADTASNGEQALDMVERQTYDLVLMDLHMPEMDGFETCRRLRKQYSYGELPVIAMTAAVLEEDIAQTKVVGMNGHIAKPIDFKLLANTLCRWLGEQPQWQEPATLAEPGTAQGLALPDELGIDERDLLERFQGDRELVLRLLQSFARQYGSGLPLPSEGEDPLEPLIRYYHTLKGSAATLNLKPLTKLANEAEQSCRAGEPEHEPVAQELTRVLDALKPWLAQQDLPMVSTSEAPTTDIQMELSYLQQQISRFRLPNDEHIEGLRKQVSHPKLGKQFRTLLMELEEFKYQSALVTLDEISRQLNNQES